MGLVLLLALMVGALQLAIGFLRMGFIINFVSRPVLSGFIYASAVVISVSQAGHLLGLPAPEGRSTLAMAQGLVGRIGETSLPTLSIGLGSIAAVVILARARPRVPGPLLAVAAGALAVYLLGLDTKGVSVVGEMPRGLPAFSLPVLNLDALRALAPAAVVVAFVGFIESISVAKAVAAREGYKIDSSQELKGLGLANVAAAFFSGFPVAGSFSRTAVQYRSGGRTQMASIMTALMVLVVLLFLTPLFYYLPDAALAAVILVAVYGLVDPREARRIFRIRKDDGIAMLVAFGGTILAGAEQGIIAGAVFSLLAFVRRTAYPRISELGYVGREDAFLG